LITLNTNDENTNPNPTVGTIELMFQKGDFPFNGKEVSQAGILSFSDDRKVFSTEAWGQLKLRYAKSGTGHITSRSLLQPHIQKRLLIVINTVPILTD
jgi:hypothetical protein